MPESHLQLLETIGKSPQWLAIAYDESFYQLLNQMALKNDTPLACVQKGDLNTLRSILSEGVEPQVVLLDLSFSSNLLDDAKKALRMCLHNTRLIIFGKDDHISIFRDLKHLGITDYLILPINESDIRNAIEEANSVPRVTETAVKHARPFTMVIGARGGVGASTIATNMAWMTFGENKRKVCLFDLDLYNNTTCIFLDLVPNRGLNDSINEISRVDEVFLKRVLLQKEEGFSIFTGQLGLEQEISFLPDALSSLMSILRDMFEFVYIDMPVSTLHASFAQTILSMADNVVIVTDLSLVSVQALLRLKVFLTTFFPYLQTKIIANNIFPDGGAISKEMFEKSSGLTIHDVFPYCKASMLEGVNTGEPFVKTYPQHMYSKKLRSFIISLYPQLKLEENKSISFLEKWLRVGK